MSGGRERTGGWDINNGYSALSRLKFDLINPQRKAAAMSRRLQFQSKPSSKSDALRLNMKKASLVSFHKPNLGDKLQRIGRHAPQYLVVIELLADQILQRVNSGASM